MINSCNSPFCSFIKSWVVVMLTSKLILTSPALRKSSFCLQWATVKAVSQYSHQKQESPPAWTQEAYRPPCSKHSLCCPNWVTWPGLPPTRVPPLPGYPPPGYPPARVPPLRLDLAGHPPPPVAAPWHSGKCCKALWDMGTPLGVDKLTKWNYYLPVVLRTRAVIKWHQLCICFRLHLAWADL